MPMTGGLLSKNRNECLILPQFDRHLPVASGTRKSFGVVLTIGHRLKNTDLNLPKVKIGVFKDADVQLAPLLLNDRPADSKRQFCERLQA